MKAVLLAAGVGSRLRPLTDVVPKSLVPVAGAPPLVRALAHVRSVGISEVGINLHHLPEPVQAEIGDGSRFGVEVRYSFEPTLLGTAGALEPFSEWLGEETFLVYYADNIIECDLGALLETHRKRRAALTVALHERDDVSSSGVAVVDEDGLIRRFVEKPRTGDVEGTWVSAGLLVCETVVLATSRRFDRADFGRNVIPDLIATGEPVAAHYLRGRERLVWIDTPADLRDARRLLDQERTSAA